MTENELEKTAQEFLDMEELSKNVLEKLGYEIKDSDRGDIPKKEFAEPNKEEAGHKGKYPIPDAQHYRSALGFAKMHGDSAAISKIKAKGKAMGFGKDEKEKASAASEFWEKGKKFGLGKKTYDEKKDKWVNVKHSSVHALIERTKIARSLQRPS